MITTLHLTSSYLFTVTPSMQDIIIERVSTYNHKYYSPASCLNQLSPAALRSNPRKKEHHNEEAKSAIAQTRCPRFKDITGRQSIAYNQQRRLVGIQ
jgi:hypothetical protein